MCSFLDIKDKAFWRALLGVVSLGVSIGLAVIGLLTLGHGLLLDMTHGSDHRTGLDLSAAEP